MKRFFLIIACLLGPSTVFAESLYVDGIEYSSIQDAIDDAHNGDVVIVEPNTYYETIDFMAKAITVRSTEPNNPSIVAATIIDANNPTDPNFGSAVLFHSGETSASVLEGFTIRNGTGSWILVSWEFKGLRWNRCGGGALCYNMSAPTIRKNVFINNMAGQGGGIYVYGDPVNANNPSNPSVHISPVITCNTFINNSAVQEHGFEAPNTNYPANDHGDGGAIVCFQGVDAVITDNLLEENLADYYGGGVHWRQWSDGVFADNKVINNDSRLGGGLHITYTSSPTISGNLVKGNTSTNLGGGGIYIYYLSDPIVEKNIITENASTNGAGIAVKYSSISTIRNNVVTGNTKGAAIISTNSNPRIYHNTITGNSSYNKAGIYCEGVSTPVIENNIIASNSNSYGILSEQGAAPVIRYNNVWNNDLGNYKGGNDLTGIDGNISVDPKIISEPNFSFHLHHSSECMGAGDPNFVPAVNETDFDGDPRILNQRTDIGADEVLPVKNLTKGTEHVSLQSAIDAANDFDNIIAVKGTYYEVIDFNSKNISLSSINAANWGVIEQTIIDGNGLPAAVVTFNGTEDSNCVLRGFTIQNGDDGGVNGNQTSARLEHCFIRGNSSSIGAGIYNFDGAIDGCKVISNTATYGAGLAECDGKIVNCIIARNTATQAGGGLYNCGADIINNTVAGNCALNSAAGLYDCDGVIENTIIWYNNSPNHPALQNCTLPMYCCIQDSNLGDANNCIYDEPSFVDANDNFHIYLNSPCIDIGDNNSVMADMEMDIDKEERIFNGIVDMGADELVLNIVDFNIDGIVDGNDLSAIILYWLQEVSGVDGDLYEDGFIDFKDFAVFGPHWLWRAGWYEP